MYSIMKYKLTDETKLHEGKTLYRIMAMRDFGDVKLRELGGFVESMRNLSHSGECWVYKGAIVKDNAQVIDDALIGNTAIIKDNAKVSGNSVVNGTTVVGGFTRITDTPVVRAYV